MEKIIDVMRNIMDEYNTVSKKRGELVMLLNNEKFNDNFNGNRDIEVRKNKTYLDKLMAIEFCIEEMMVLLSDEYSVCKEHIINNEKRVSYCGTYFIGIFEYDEYRIYNENGEEI